MDDAVPERESGIVAGIPEGAREPVLDALLYGWARLASFAWDSYRQHGRGAVLVAPGRDRLKLTYLSASSCLAPDGLLEIYDPDTQVVVAISHSSHHTSWIGPVSGWPSPVDAWHTVPAATLG